MAGCGHIETPESAFFRKLIGNKTLFFHKTEVRPGTTLREGDKVEFEVNYDPTDSKRICANRIRQAPGKGRKKTRSRSRSKSSNARSKSPSQKGKVSDRVKKFFENKKEKDKATSRVSKFLKKVDGHKKEKEKAQTRVSKFLKKVKNKTDKSPSQSPSQSRSRSASQTEKKRGAKRTRSRSADKKANAARTKKRSRVRSASSSSDKSMSASASRSQSPSEKHLLEIQNIEASVPDALLSQILSLCGPVKEWERNANKVSGTVEFAQETAKAIAIQILSATSLRGQLLSVANKGKPPGNSVIAATAARRPSVEAEIKKLIQSTNNAKRPAASKPSAKRKNGRAKQQEIHTKGSRIKAMWFPDKKYYSATVVSFNDKKGVYIIQFDDAGNQHEREVKHIRSIAGSKRPAPQPQGQAAGPTQLYNPSDAVVETTATSRPMVDPNSRQTAIAAIDFGSKFTKVSVALSNGALLGQLALFDGHDGSPCCSNVLIRVRHDDPNAGKLVKDIMKIGVNQNRAKKAVYLGKATELTSAMTWLLHHADDADIDEDYVEQAAVKVVAFGPHIEDSKSIAELQSEDGYTFHIIRDIKAKFIGRKRNEDYQEVQAEDGTPFEFSMVVQDTVRFLVDKVREQCPRILHSRATVEKIVLTVPTILQGGSITQEELGSFMIPMHDAIADQRHIPCLTVSEGISSLVYIISHAPAPPDSAVLNIDVGAFAVQTAFVYRSAQGKYHFSEPAGWIMGGQEDNRLFEQATQQLITQLEAVLQGTRRAVMDAYEQAKRREWVNDTQAFVVFLPRMAVVAEATRQRFDKILDTTGCTMAVEMARDGQRLVVRLGKSYKDQLGNRVNRIVDAAVGYTRAQLATVQKATGRQVAVRVELSGGGSRDSLVRTALEKMQNNAMLPNVTVHRQFTSSEAVCFGGLEICKNSEWLEESVTKLQGEVRCRGKDILFPAQTVTYKGLRQTRSYRQAGSKTIKVPISIANECADHPYLELAQPGQTVEVIAEFQTSNKLRVVCRAGQRTLSEEFYYVPVLPTLRQLSSLIKA